MQRGGEFRPCIPALQQRLDQLKRQLSLCIKSVDTFSMKRKIVIDSEERYFKHYGVTSIESKILAPLLYK